MSSIVRSLARNPINASYSPGTTGWVVVGIHASTRVVTPYATMALLLAAGDRPFPGLDPGATIENCLFQSLTSAGAVGSGILYKLDPVGNVAPTAIADADNEVDGSGQQIDLPCPFRIIWTKNLAPNDVVKLAGRF